MSVQKVSCGIYPIPHSDAQNIKFLSTWPHTQLTFLFKSNTPSHPLCASEIIQQAPLRIVIDLCSAGDSNSRADSSSWAEGSLPSAEGLEMRTVLYVLNGGGGNHNVY